MTLHRLLLAVLLAHGSSRSTAARLAPTGHVLRWVHAIAVGCTILVGLALSGMFLLSGVESVGVAWPVTHPEGVTVSAVLRVRDGQPLYQDFREYPYVITPYAPVQPVVCGLLSRLFGLNVLEAVTLTRSLTLAASLTVAVLIWLVGRTSGARPLAALAGAALFLALPFLDEWGFASRPDLPALAFSILALLLVMRRPSQIWLAALVSVVAFFTKQTAVAMPVAAVVWLVLTGRWRASGVFVGVWFGVTLVAVVLLEVATGRLYLLNVLYSQLMTPKNGFDIAIRDLMPFVTDGWLPVGLAALALALSIVRRTAAQPACLPACYLVASLGLTLVSLRNNGSDVNYLIAPTAAACMLATVAIDRLWRLEGGLARVRPVVSCTLAAIAMVWGAGLWEFWRLDGGVNVGRMPLEEIRAAEVVLSEEPMAVLLAGRSPVLPDMFHASQLTTGGLFDPSEPAERIKRSEFDLIVMRSDVSAPRRWKRQLLVPEAIRLAIKDVYHPAGRVGIFWLYRPEGRRSPRQ